MLDLIILIICIGSVIFFIYLKLSFWVWIYRKLFENDD